VSKLMKRKRLKFGLRESSHRSIYRYTKVNSLSYNSIFFEGYIISQDRKIMVTLIKYTL